MMRIRGMRRIPRTFWVVQGLGSDLEAHKTRPAAEAQARRYALARPGTVYHVMEAIVAFRSAEIERVDLRVGSGARAVDPADRPDSGVSALDLRSRP